MILAMEFYEQVLEKFGSKYGDLIEFESKLADAELPEHPCWEESIEYRNAYEELESLRKGGFVVLQVNDCDWKADSKSINLQTQKSCPCS